MKKTLVTLAAALLCAGLAQAGNIPINNPGFETGDGSLWYSPQSGVPGVVKHATYPAPNNETLSNYFGYYSPGDATTTWLAQQTASNFTANYEYTFKAWMCNGGSANGFLEIGTCTTPGDWNTYTALSNMTFALSASWAEYSFTYKATASDAGKPVVARFPNKPGNTGGVWIDNVDLNWAVPEPALGIALALSVLALLRRR